MSNKIKSIRKDEILIIGIGQGGCMFTHRLQERGYKSLFVNSATGDLTNLVGVEPHHMLHYDGADGAGQSREIGLEYAQNNIEKIFERIDKQYFSVKYIFFAFSGAGGTGGGGAPYVIEKSFDRYSPFSKKKQEEDELGFNPIPDRHIGAIMILPSKEDGIPLQGYKNALACYEDISNLVEAKKVNAVFLADNSKMDAWELNEEFADDFDSLITLPERVSGTGKSLDSGDLIKALEGTGYIHMADYTLRELEDKERDVVHIKPVSYMPKFVKSKQSHGILATIDFMEDGKVDVMSYFKEYYTPASGVTKLATVMGEYDEEVQADVENEENEEVIFGLTSADIEEAKADKLFTNRVYGFGLAMPQVVKQNIATMYNEEVAVVERTTVTEKAVKVELKEVVIKGKNEKGEAVETVIASIEKETKQPTKKLSQKEMLLMRKMQGKKK